MHISNRGFIAFVVALLALLVTSRPAVTVAQETYASISTAHYEVKYQKGVAEADVRKLLDYLQNDYKYLADRLGFEMQKKIEVRIYESIGKFSEETNLKQPWRIAYYSHGILYVRPIRSVPRRKDLDHAVSYENVLAMLDQKTAQGCPRWLIEALAVYHSGEMEDLTPASNVRYSSFADLSQDVQEYQDPPQRDDIHYLLGKTMKFFVTKYGEARTFSLFKQFDGSSNVEKVFKKVLGADYSSVEKSWAEYVAAHTTPFK